MTDLEKRGIVIMLGREESAAFMASADPSLRRRERMRREVPPTPEQIAQHARATELLAELERNPYYWWGREEEPCIEPLRPRIEIDYEETVDEWVDRVHREYRELVTDQSSTVSIDGLQAALLGRL